MAGEPQFYSRFRELVEPLPGVDGGLALVAVVDSTPPAMALLSAGSVYAGAERVSFAVEATSSVANADAASATLLVAADGEVLRVSVSPLHREIRGPLTVLSGPPTLVRPSVEIPWRLRLEFQPSGAPGQEDYVRYWRECRSWLADPTESEPPSTPDPRPGDL